MYDLSNRAIHRMGNSSKSLKGQLIEMTIHQLEAMGVKRLTKFQLMQLVVVLVDFVRDN